MAGGDCVGPRLLTCVYALSTVERLRVSCGLSADCNPLKGTDMTITIETLPAVECTPWCEHGDGHTDAMFPEDQWCSGQPSSGDGARHSRRRRRGGAVGRTLDTATPAEAPPSRRALSCPRG